MDDFKTALEARLAKPGYSIFGTEDPEDPNENEGATFGGNWQATADISDAFFDNVNAMAARMQVDPRYLLGVWMNESGIRNVPNGAGAPYYGLNQLSGSQLEQWGISPQDYLTWSLDRQLPIVERFYSPYVAFGLNSTGRLYQANFLPATLRWGSDPNIVLLYDDASQRTEHQQWISEAQEHSFYQANKWFDHQGNGYITIQDLTDAVDSHAANPRLVEAIQRLGELPPLPSPSSLGGVVKKIVTGGAIGGIGYMVFRFFSRI